LLRKEFLWFAGHYEAIKQINQYEAQILFTIDIAE